MPRRINLLINDHFYHVFNRGVEKRTTFTNMWDYRRMLNILEYYSLNIPLLKFSNYRKLTISERKNVYMLAAQNNNPAVTIIGYCLMPNHFHLLLKQVSENGISNFLRKTTDSYTKYFNIKNDRVGPLFQGQFKSVMIESENQLLHVSRYIHLNPYSSALVGDTDELQKYPWSSFREYATGIHGLCDHNLITSLAGGKQKYKEFTLNHADYQKTLKNIEHLLYE